MRLKVKKKAPRVTLLPARQKKKNRPLLRSTAAKFKAEKGPRELIEYQQKLDAAQRAMDHRHHETALGRRAIGNHIA